MPAGAGAGGGGASGGGGATQRGAGAAVETDTEHTSRNSFTPEMGTAVPDLNALLSNGVFIYNGADDNLDAGEHDGGNGCATNPPDRPGLPRANDRSSPAGNGPPDRGATPIF